jgi:hypothetical protein
MHPVIPIAPGASRPIHEVGAQVTTGVRGAAQLGVVGVCVGHRQHTPPTTASG